MQKTHRGVKTTVEIPEPLWEKAKRKALDERSDLRTMILEGLTWRVGRKKGGRQ